MTFRRLVFSPNLGLMSSLFSGQVSNHIPFLWPFQICFLSFSVSGLHLKVSVLFLRPPRSTAVSPKTDWTISKSYLTDNRLQFNSSERSSSWRETTSHLQKEFWTNSAILRSMLQGHKQANHPPKFFMPISTTIDFSMTLQKPSSISPKGHSFFSSCTSLPLPSHICSLSPEEHQESLQDFISPLSNGSNRQSLQQITKADCFFFTEWRTSSFYCR